MATRFAPLGYVLLAALAAVADAVKWTNIAVAGVPSVDNLVGSSAYPVPRGSHVPQVDVSFNPSTKLFLAAGLLGNVYGFSGASRAAGATRNGTFSLQLDTDYNVSSIVRVTPCSADGALISWQSCPAGGQCIAAGAGQPVSTWQATGWSIKRALAVPKTFTFSYIECVDASFCVAVGADAALADETRQTGGLIFVRRNGTWILSQASVPAMIDVTCSSRTDCMAVGDLSTVMAFNGTKWTPVPFPNATLDPFKVVQVVGDTTFIFRTESAADDSTVARIYYYSKSRRTFGVVPPSVFFGVSDLLNINCPTTTDCIALGLDSDAYGNVIYRWKGPSPTGWTKDSVSATTITGIFNAVECSTPCEKSISDICCQCVAVGEHGVAAVTRPTLAKACLSSKPDSKTQKIRSGQPSVTTPFKPEVALVKQALDASKVLVLDLGSTTVRAGYAGDGMPQLSFPNVYVTLANGTILVGRPAVDSGRPTKNPIVNGILSDTPGLVLVIKYALGLLGVRNTAQVANKLIFLVSPLNTMAVRMAFSTRVMTEFSPAALWIGQPALVEPFITGSVSDGTQALSLDFGQTASAVPVFKQNGNIFTYLAAIRTTTLVASDLDSYIARQLRITAAQAAELKQARNVFFASVPDAAASRGRTPSARFRLANGTNVTVPGDLRWTVPEAIFRPRIIGIGGPGLANIAAAAVAATPQVYRAGAMTMKIVVAGGSTLFRGFGDRLRIEIGKLSPWNLVRGNIDNTQALHNFTNVLMAPGSIGAAFRGASGLGAAPAGNGPDYVLPANFTASGAAAFATVCLPPNSAICACDNAQASPCSFSGSACLCT
ncbi:actin-domain-containing protein [Hyaloraphidium curvatum]|nr:actin-domain-containing protein [Hyaloraphidium curvatum]